MDGYTNQQRTKCFERIADICEGLPKYCGAYIRSVATKKDTSYRSGMQYAYEVQTFIRYAAGVYNVPASKVTAAMLEELRPMDIEQYIDSLSSYETPEDMEYNRGIRDEAEKAKAEGATKREIAAILSRPAKRHHKGVSARARSLAAVRGLYRYLVKNGMASKNPAELASSPVPTAKPVVALKPDDVETVLERVEETGLSGRQKAFSEKQRLRDTALFALLLYTGIRASECAGLDLSDIDWRDGRVKVLRKGGRIQMVYFNDYVKESLREYVEKERVSPKYDSDALFVTRFGERMSTKAIGNVVKKFTDGVSGNKITTHKLRSSYATQLYKNTGDAMLVKDALGHQTLAVVQKYIDAADDNRRDAAKKIRY